MIINNNNDTKHYFSYNFKILRIFGLWSCDDKNNNDKKMDNIYEIFYSIYRIIFLITFAYLFTLLEIIELLISRNNFDDFINNLCYTIVHVMACSKITLIIAKADDIRRICYSFGYGLFKPIDDVSLKMIDRCIYRSEKLLIIYFIIATSVVINGLLCPLYVSNNYTGYDGNGFEKNITSLILFGGLKKLRKLPYVSYFPFDVNVTPNYELAYVYQGISLMTLSPIIVTIDVLYGSILLHIATQLKILSISLADVKPNRIQNINKNNFGYITDINNRLVVIDDPLKGQSLKRCILHHQAIISTTEEMEIIFSPLVLLQFLSNLVIMCFPLFQITSVPVMSFPFFSMVSLMVAMMYQLFIFCDCGDEVNQQSLLVANSAYFADWHRSSGSYMRWAVLMIVHRAQKPLRLTVAKFAMLSRETYLKVVQGSVSYFMFLRKVRDK